MWSEHVHVIVVVIASNFWLAFLQRFETWFSKDSSLWNLLPSNFSSALFVIWKPFIFTEVNVLVVTKRWHENNKHCLLYSTVFCLRGNKTDVWWLVKPYAASFEINKSCLRQSHAFDKSVTTIPPTPLLSNFFLNFSTIRRRLCWMLWPCRNPHWRLEGTRLK